jgi:hypothetical protein
MEHEDSLPCSQEPATGPYSKPDESSPQLHIVFSKIPFIICKRATCVAHLTLLDLIILIRSDEV